MQLGHTTAAVLGLCLYELGLLEYQSSKNPQHKQRQHNNKEFQTMLLCEKKMQQQRHLQQQQCINFASLLSYELGVVWYNGYISFEKHVDDHEELFRWSSLFCYFLADQTEGIFRVSGSKVQIDSLKDAIDSGSIPDLSRISEPHTISSLFKLYLRSLPDTLIPMSRYFSFLSLTKIEPREQQVINFLSSSFYLLLFYFIFLIRLFLWTPTNIFVFLDCQRQN